MTPNHPVLDFVLYSSPNYLSVWIHGPMLYVMASINVRLDTSRARDLVSLRERLTELGATLLTEVVQPDNTMMGGQSRFRTYSITQRPGTRMIA